MTPKIVKVPSIQKPIQPSPGFAKKLLADHKLDLLGLCQFGCRYCSSNRGNYLRINSSKFADATERQIGERLMPVDEPSLMFTWPEVIDRLSEQLKQAPKSWGLGETLVFSMLTDGFSPKLVKDGVTEEALRLVLERTSFRIRVLTKNAIVGSRKWIQFFQSHPGRFVVGLSIGTLNNSWAKRIEQGTSQPTARLAALRSLQDASVPTFGMLCPVFPDVLAGDGLERLVDLVRPRLVEDFWAEPFNDRDNWKKVRDGYAVGTAGYEWFSDVYGKRQTERWSSYNTDLYLRLRDKARREGWIGKLHYLLYEHNVTQSDAPQFAGLEGVLLQSKPSDDGRSQNRFVAALQ